MNGKQLKNSILQGAVQGKLVPHDPNDEPASVLLERIREDKKRLVKEGKIKKDKNESIIYRGEDNSHYEKFADGTVKCIDDEIPFEVPQGWEWTRIGSIYSHSSGKQQSASHKKVGTLRKYITTSNLYWGHFVLDKVKEMYFSVEELESCSAKEGDLLVCEGGAGYGRSAIWDKDYDICLQNHVHRLRPIVRGVCEYTLFYIYLLKESCQLESVGTAMPGLSANRLKSILIPLPPLTEQQRIVAKLYYSIPLVERYGQLQDELDNLNDSLINSSLKKSILQQAIQGYLVAQDPNDEPASMLLERIREEKQKLLKEGKIKKKDIVDSVIFKGEDSKYYEKVGSKVLDVSEEIPFDIPDSWAWIRIGEYVRLITDFVASGSFASLRENVRYYKNENYAILVKTQDFQNNFSKDLTYTDEHGYRFLSGSNLFGGELIISNVGSIGKVFIVPHLNRPMTLAPNAIMVKAFDSEHIPWLYSLLSSNYGLSLMFSISSATAMRKFNKTDFKRLIIPIPPLAEQARIVAQLNTVIASTMRK